MNINSIKVITPDNLGKKGLPLTLKLNNGKFKVVLIVLRLAHYLQNLGRKALPCSLSKMGSASN